MKIKYQKRLIGIICALMVCLIASTAITVLVADETYWGNLKIGDEMRWHWQPGYAGSYTDIYYEIQILEIQEDSLRVDHNQSAILGGSGDTYTYKREIANFKYDELTQELYEEELMQELYWIYPTSLIQENEDIQTKTYEYDGNTYNAAYLKEEYSEVVYEFWWDYSTGILVEYKRDPSEYGHVGMIILEYTNAELTEPTGRSFCLGTLLIAFISVATLVSYSIKLRQKRKKP